MVEPGPGIEGDGAPGAGSRAASAIVVSEDLLLGLRIADTLGRLGCNVVSGRSEASFKAAIEAGASLVVVDLGAKSVDPLGAIRSAKSLGIAVLAYGSHVDVEALSAAREAGADEVVPRSVIASGLTALAGKLLAGRGGTRS
jgi:hypothetical protein